MSGNTNVAVEICSAALNLVGADEILSFSDESKEAKLCNSLYPIYRDALMQDYPWRFSLERKQLAQLSNAPLYEFDFAYQLPSDFLRLISAEGAEDYVIVGNEVHTNTSTLRVVYQKKVNESKFPAYFKMVLQTRLASILAIALREDVNMETRYQSSFLRELIRAKSIDSQQQPNSVMPTNNFLLRNTRTF